MKPCGLTGQDVQDEPALRFVGEAVIQPNRRILVIDDNRAIHDDFRKILAGGAANGKDLAKAEAELFGSPDSGPVADDFEIGSAFQGQEGLELVTRAVAEGRPYALAFIDVRMPPGWDGIETTAEIWKVDPQVQVVICTAYSDYSWDKMTARLGRSDQLVILKKPFDNIEVSQLAQALTNKWVLGQQARQRLNGLEAAVQERTLELLSANRTLQAEITQRERSEQERQAMEMQLRQAQKLEAIGQLAAGIAHEINTPTQYVGDNTRFLEDSFKSILRVAEVCKRLIEGAKTGSLTPEMLAASEEAFKASDVEYLNSEIPQAIHETLEGVERVTKIVQAMKEFSHPGSKQKMVTDLNRAIESTVTVARNEWKYVAEMKLDLDPGLPAVPCFVGEFNQCILNLVINAAHAIGNVVGKEPGAKGLITLSTRRDGNEVEIRVQDTGTGIPKAVQPHIFEPFFTTKEVGKGTGQGLSMVYASVVKRHGGAITFETEEGRGTVFVLRLPLEPARTGAVTEGCVLPMETGSAKGTFAN